MKTLRAIIVDDEWMARQNLEKMLLRHCPEVEVVALCESVDDARNALSDLQPDLVFLDVKMPGEDGFSIFNDLKERNFTVVFVTAHTEFSLRAFGANAVHYLLKPILSDDLKEAVKRAVKMQYAQDEGGSASGTLTKIALHTTDGLQLVAFDEIVRFEAMATRTKVFFANGESLLLPRNLKKVEMELPKNCNFFRVHHSHLVNLEHVVKYIKADGGFLLLSNGTEIEVSRRRRMELLNHLGKANL